ncbi:MAG: alkaline phosphatase family protein [Magnetococcales bacterium]|nr:alkaline phosphatase family protein [Magnetococcales bacterium]
MMATARKMLVIGIDGATFNIINPLIEAGRLPNLQRLMEKGAHGPLRTIVPMVSPVAWTSFFTGMKPGNHKIFDFFSREPNSNNFRMSSARDRGVLPIWSILSKSDKKVCVSGVTWTYPPDEVNGTMVSGLGAPPESTKNFTHPPELSQEIVKRFGPYQVIPKTGMGLESIRGKQAFLDEIFRLIEYRGQMSQFLMDQDDYDFTMCFFIDTDGVSHNYWEYIDPQLKDRKPEETQQFGEAIYNVYERVDKEVGGILAKAGEDTNVVLLSDHGFGPMRRILHLNNWLAQQGWVVFKKRSIWPFLMAKIRSKWAKIRGKSFAMQTDVFLDTIDWSKTKAYFHGTTGTIFFNLKGREKEGIVPPDTYMALGKEIAAGLMELKDPDTGEKVVERVYTRDEVFTGEFMAISPDLLVTLNPHFGFATREKPHREGEVPVITDADNWTGDHEIDGIFIGYGPDFKAGQKVEGANIIDLAPTILNLMQHPIPKNMDGKILESALDETFLANHKPEYSDPINPQDGSSGSVYSDDEDQQVKDTLKDLGYL